MIELKVQEECAMKHLNNLCTRIEYFRKKRKRGRYWDLQ